MKFLTNSKLSVRLAVAAITLSAIALTAEISGFERDEGLKELYRTRNGVVQATQGLTEAQWKYKPAPDRWSVAETVEHIVMSEDMLLENVVKVMKTGGPPKTDRDVKALDKKVLAAISDRSTKVKAPDALAPAGKWTTKEAVDRFVKSREKTIEYLKTTAGLRDHAADSPLGQALDAYQWILYISAHSERHTKQIQEVKADPGFPKKGS